MKNKCKSFKQLLARLRTIRIYIKIGNEVKAETKTFTLQFQEPILKHNGFGGMNATAVIKPGFIAIMLTSEAYTHLINGLADADQWTGFQYSEKVFNQSTIIKN